MKVFIILFIAGFGSQIDVEANEWAQVEEIGYFQTYALDLIPTLVPRGCKGEGIVQEQNNARECIKNIRYNISFCDTFVRHFKPCVQGLLDETKKCEEPLNTAMKNSIIDSVIDKVKFLCGLDGERILELLNPCVTESVKLSRRCRHDITVPLKNEKDLYIKCSHFPTIKSCFEDQIQHECTNEMTRKTVHDFFSNDVKPCDMGMQIFFEVVGGS